MRPHMNFLMCCSSIYAHVMSLLSQSKLDWAWASGEGQNEWKFVFHTLLSLFHTDQYLCLNRKSILKSSPSYENQLKHGKG